ncbi:MAG: hypothetical protein PVF43_12100 [Candidatus Eiseniibacteriota bacterium]
MTGADAVYVWHHNGKELLDGDQNPQTSGVFSTDGQDGDFGFHATPAVADLDDDGLLEVIGVAWRDARVHVWDPDGVAFPGWPQTIGGDFNWASPLADDLDLDGDLEIVAVSGLQGKVYAWHHDATELVDADPSTNGVFYDTPTSFLYASPGAGNISGGPLREIVVASNHSSGYVYAFDLNGDLLPGWPFTAGGQVTASPTLVDLDDDGLDETLFAAEDDSLYVMRGDATHYPGWPQRVATDSDFGHTSSVVVADVDSDGELESSSPPTPATCASGTWPATSCPAGRTCRSPKMRSTAGPRSVRRPSPTSTATASWRSSSGPRTAWSTAGTMTGTRRRASRSRSAARCAAR